MKGGWQASEPAFGPPRTLPLTHTAPLFERRVNRSEKKNQHNTNNQKNKKKTKKTKKNMCCVHALLWLQDLPLAMALSPLLPWLLENSTYTAQSICEQRQQGR